MICNNDRRYLNEEWCITYYKWIVWIYSCWSSGLFDTILAAKYRKTDEWDLQTAFAERMAAAQASMAEGWQ